MAVGLTTSCSPMFCSFPYSGWSQAMALPSQSISTCTATSGVHLLPAGHALHHREGGLGHLMGFLQPLFRLIGIRSDPGKKALDRHKVPLLAGLFIHVVAFLCEPSQQKSAVISPIDGVEEISRKVLPVVPKGLEVLVTLELPVFDPGHFLRFSFPLL